jgi:hypothetical protein
MKRIVVSFILGPGGRLLVILLFTVASVSILIRLPGWWAGLGFVVLTAGLWFLALLGSRRPLREIPGYLLQTGIATLKYTLLKPLPAQWGAPFSHPVEGKPRLLIPGWVRVVGILSLIFILLIIAFSFLAGQYGLFAILLLLMGVMALSIAFQAQPQLHVIAWNWLRWHLSQMRREQHIAQRAPHKQRQRLVPLLFLVELAIITYVALDVTKEFRQDNPDMRLRGYEAEYLTSSAHQAYLGLHEYGYIPLWQPWLENGEPLITSPFAFVMNPLSSVPSLIYGGLKGIKISVVVYVVFGGVGGWFLGRVLGLGPLGRTLLGVLMVGKGYTHAALSAGFFQLAVSQMIMPWIIAGTVATLRHKDRRWPPVLLAVMATLLLWAGNIWYTLPMTLSVGLVVLVDVPLKRGHWVDWAALRWIAWAAVLIVGLSAIVLLPLWTQREYVAHPEEENRGGAQVELTSAIEQYYDGDPEVYYRGEGPGRPQTYYSFITPFWFLVLIFVMFPPVLPPFFHHPAFPGTWRLWLASVLLITFFTLWGAGGSPFIALLYDNISLIQEWRFVGRALAAGAFWVGLLVAIRVDALAQIILNPYWLRTRLRSTVIRAAQTLLILVLIWSSARAAHEVTSQWGAFGLLDEVDQAEDICISWLREQYPDKPLSVYRHGYDAVTTYLDNEVRLFNIEVAYHAQSRSLTVGGIWLPHTLPEYAIVWTRAQRIFVSGAGFEVMKDSPTPHEGFNCLYHKEDSLSYAFAVPLSALGAPSKEIDPARTQPLTDFSRKPGKITLQATRDPKEILVIVVQELAFPGWHVWVDDRPVQLESAGGMIGLLLPPGDDVHTLRFEFRPAIFFQSAGLTVLTCLFCILYLLRADRVVRWALRRL